jgi:1-acyl-sn-glycerol-3-phosphate acyltransferase
MLDLPRLERLRLVRRPVSQRFFGWLLHANYRWWPGVRLALEDGERIPNEPVIFAMNHTDRYNYFPFQYLLWQEFDRFTATWVKGKYYENALLAQFMESMFQLPTVSRGYLITRDFVAVMGRTPTDQEYALLREAVDARAVGEAGVLPEPPEVPEMLLRKPRNPFGVSYDPAEADYADYICSLFRQMMGRFVELNREARDIGLDLLVFPQGTRSIRLLPGHIGIAQMALYLKIPIVPVGCNGSDRVYPGGSPFAKKGAISYRVGPAIPYDELAPFHIAEDYAPFSAVAERDYAEPFKAVAALVTDRIEPLLDPEYRRADDDEAEDLRSERGVNRFV